MPAFKDDSKRMKNIFSSIFATHNSTWADFNNLLNTLLTSEECRMVLDKAGEDADPPRTETPGNPVGVAANVAIPTADPNWDVNAGDRPKLERY